MFAVTDRVMQAKPAADNIFHVQRPVMRRHCVRACGDHRSGARLQVAHDTGCAYHSAAMKIAIASDHAALELKDELTRWLREAGHQVEDLGSHSAASVDYPDYGYLLAEAVGSGTSERGVALCGTGIGISMAVNRDARVRCALVNEPVSARLTRLHNDANIIAMGARMIGPEIAKACLETFLATDFEGGRHQRRVDKLSEPPQELQA